MKHPLNFPELKITSPFLNTEQTLRKRIELSLIFVIYGNKRFYFDLRTGNGSTREQIKIAIELRKPVILLLDKKLSSHELVDIRLIPNLNIIKEVIYDFSNKDEKLRVEKEITEYCKEEEKMKHFSFRWY